MWLALPALVHLALACARPPADAAPVPTVPADPPAPALTVADLGRHPWPASFDLVGWVGLVHVCPPCPDGADCKPCLSDVVVSDDPTRRHDDHSTLTDADAVVYYGNAGDVPVGSRWRFSVMSQGEDATGPAPVLFAKSARPEP